MSAIAGHSIASGQLADGDRRERDPEQRHGRQQRARAGRPDPLLADVQQRPAGDEVQDARAREVQERRRRRAREVAEAAADDARREQRRRGDRRSARTSRRTGPCRGRRGCSASGTARSRCPRPPRPPRRSRTRGDGVLCGRVVLLRRPDRPAEVQVGHLRVLRAPRPAGPVSSTRPDSMTIPSVASRRPKRTFCSTSRIVLPASRIRTTFSKTCLSAFGSSPSDGSSRSTSFGSSISERANSTIRRWPPERLPAFSAARSRTTGNSSSTSS